MTYKYKHTQISYFMVAITFVTFLFFLWVNFLAINEPVSIESGSNFLVTSIMFLIIFILSSFTSLTTIVDEKYFQVKFGYGIFSKEFLLDDISSLKVTKNKWYYGFGIRVWFWPYMWIYNISGLDAVEIVLENGKIYRIGTDVPDVLFSELNKNIIL